LQRAQYCVRGAGDFAWRVDILDADEPLAVGLASGEVARDGGNERADMQRASRRGGEPADVRSGLAARRYGSARPASAVLVIPVAVLAFGELAAFLGFDAKRCDRTRLQPP